LRVRSSLSLSRKMGIENVDKENALAVKKENG